MSDGREREFGVIVAGGGTGGHFFPGLAVAQALAEGDPPARITFAGSAHGIEARFAPLYGFPFAALPAWGFAGTGLLNRVRALAVVPLALARAVLLFVKVRPRAVVGVGGYASFPVALAAGLAGIPLLLLEQNVQPGLANRVASAFASRVAVSFPQTLPRFRSKAWLAGNPVRASVTAVPPEAPPERPFRLLVFGGSLGARAINEAFIAALPDLKAFSGGLSIRHQTGEADLARVRAAYEQAGVAATVEPFIVAMDEALAWCHACVCRAGATTLAELSASHRPSLLIPYPHAAGGHQVLNAQGLEALGGALVLEQKSLTTERLMASLAVLADAGRRRAMAASLAAVARPKAAIEIAEAVRQMAGVAR